MESAASGFGPVRGALLFLFRRVLGVYFREVEIAGDIPAPTTGGRVFDARKTPLYSVFKDIRAYQ